MKCTVIAGAPKQDIDFLKENADRESFVIAADSGYLNCISAGIVPDLIIGDFDSSRRPDMDTEILTFPTVKNDTDTLCCIKEAVKRGADEMEIFCALGGRADHTYSNIVGLVYCLEHGIQASILSKNNIVKVYDSSFTIEKGKHKYFSLFAFGGKVEGLCIKGAAYELDNYALSPFTSLGQSNEFKNSTVEIKFHSGIILLILSND